MNSGTRMPTLRTVVFSRNPWRILWLCGEDKELSGKLETSVPPRDTLSLTGYRVSGRWDDPGLKFLVWTRGKLLWRIEPQLHLAWFYVWCFFWVLSQFAACPGGSGHSVGPDVDWGSQEGEPTSLPLLAFRPSIFLCSWLCLSQLWLFWASHSISVALLHLLPISTQGPLTHWVLQCLPYLELGENAASLHCNLARSQILELGCGYLWDWPLGGH